MTREEMEKKVAEEFGYSDRRPHEGWVDVNGDPIDIRMFAAIVDSRMREEEAKKALSGSERFRAEDAVDRIEVMVACGNKISLLNKELAALKADREKELREAFEAGFQCCQNPSGEMSYPKMLKGFAAFLKSREGEQNAARENI